MGKRDLTRFGFKIGFGRIVQIPGFVSISHSGTNAGCRQIPMAHQRFVITLFDLYSFLYVASD